jgi:hypothetical protein
VRSDIFTRLIRNQQALTAMGFHDAAHVLSGPAIQVRCMECPASVPTRGWQSLFTLISNKVFS